MDDEKLDRIMDGWMQSEHRAAPELLPTDEMRRVVEARRATVTGSGRWTWKWVSAAVAAAGMVGVLAHVFVAPSSGPTPPSLVSLRTLSRGRGGFVFEGAAPMEQAPRRGGQLYAQVLLQTNIPGSNTLVGVEHDGTNPVSISLEAGDFFRIALHPRSDLHVAVYRSATKDGEGIVRLYPAENEPARAVVLEAMQLHFIPFAPNWFFSEFGAAGHRLFVVSSKEPLTDIASQHELWGLVGAAEEGVVEIREFILRDRQN